MDTFRKLNRYALASIACGVLLSHGCAIPHAEPRATPLGRVSPLNYCPGDRIAATYSLLNNRGDACVSRPGMDCSTVAPPITIGSSPTSFPPETFTALVGGLTFAPVEPNVDVSFTTPVSPIWVAYPAVDPSTGAPTLFANYLQNKTHTVRRIDGAIHQPMTHTAMCAGTNAVYAPGVITTTPTYSPNLRLRSVCNTSPVPITVTLSMVGGDFFRDLAPGACFSLDEPGIPAGLDASQVINVRPMTVDPMQCGPLQETNPPQTLTTSVSLACGT